jgi:hypothetical protein
MTCCRRASTGFSRCPRYPQNLAQQVTLTPVRDGVYETRLVTVPARIIVVHQLPREEHNALLHLFSAREEWLRYGQEHYRPQSPETSTLLYQLFKTYSEDSDMPDKLKEFVRESLHQILGSLTPEERMKGMSAEERLKGLSAAEVVKALPPEILEEVARRLKANGSSPKSP